MSKMKIYLEDENARDEIHWYCDDNIWNLLASYRKLVVKLGFTWSRRHKTTDFRVIIHSEKKSCYCYYCLLPASIHFTQTWNKCALACGRKCMCCMCGGHVRCEDFLRVNYSRTKDETYFSDFGVVYKKNTRPAVLPGNLS